MSVYEVAEKFVSINGEGTKAGQLAVFIRFRGCNLNCSYCDTKWANIPDTSYTEMTAEEIYSYIKSTGVRNVTLTGGEPLLQKDIKEFIGMITADDALYCEIETNGAVSLKEFSDMDRPPSFTMDYKLPSSGMERFMLTENFDLLTKKDTVKFVSGSIEDLNKAKEMIDKYRLTDKVSVYISPVFGSIQPSEIVDFMKEKNMNGVNLQLQLHKFIWDPNAKGV